MFQRRVIIVIYSMNSIYMSIIYSNNNPILIYSSSS
nr:MAG TPA: hypothetical protein [Caudoviricetes sp.]